MNKLQSILKDKGLSYMSFARLMGKPSKNTEISNWIRTDKTLTELGTDTLIGISTVLEVPLTELLMDYELDGTLNTIKNVRRYTEKTRELFGIEGSGPFEGIGYVGKRFLFKLTDSVNLYRALGRQGSKICRGETLDNTGILNETVKVDEEFKRRLDNYRNENIKRKSPVVATYEEDGDIRKLTYGIFRETGESALIEKVEAIKAVWSEDPNDVWIKCYADVIFKDYSEYKEQVEENEITNTEFFELFGKIAAAIGIKM